MLGALEEQVLANPEGDGSVLDRTLVSREEGHAKGQARHVTGKSKSDSMLDLILLL